MDSIHRRIDREEWLSMEIPIADDEKQMLLWMCNCYKNSIDEIMIQTKYRSLSEYLKLECSKTDDYIFNTFFRSKIEIWINDNCLFNWNNIDKIPFLIKLNSRDRVRTQQNNINYNDSTILDFVLFKWLHQLYKNIKKNDLENLHIAFINCQTILRLHQCKNINKYLLEYSIFILKKLEENKHVTIEYCIYKSYLLYELNNFEKEYKDIQLYSHQKEIFHYFKKQKENVNVLYPYLILYGSPTGTGKTITPLAFIHTHKVIFVTAGRHIAITLARMAIDLNIKIALGFACESSDDIRLHNLSAKEYIKNTKSGSIIKIDHSQGEKVELMICDLKSYTICMNYMNQFHDFSDMILFWDEPTITLDYEYHTMHEYIHNIWINNEIPNIVLSSSTFPKFHDVPELIEYYIQKFPNGKIIEIHGEELRSSISLLDSNGKIFAPHLVQNEILYDGILKQLENKPFLKRFISLIDCIQFFKQLDLSYISINFEEYFEEISNINIQSIKNYYIFILNNLQHKDWLQYSNILQSRYLFYEVLDNNNNEYNGTSGISFTSEHAYTLTDGPTLYITQQIRNIGTYLVQQMKFPSDLINRIQRSIDKNINIMKRIHELEQQLSIAGGSIISSSTKKDKNKVIINPEKNVQSINLYESIDSEKKQLHIIQLPDQYIPNSKKHLNIWCEKLNRCYPTYIPSLLQWHTPFCSSLNESVISDILSWDNIDILWKILLLCGIGIFSSELNLPTHYIETMKQLADNIQLFMIIGSSDYIYGTNYNFSHLIIGKDIPCTQEKLIQCMGRVGRHNKKGLHTIRFRNSDTLNLLWIPISPLHSIETNNIRKLFNIF